MNLLIRAPGAADEAAWRTLWSGYNRFYRADVPADVTAALWQKLLSPDAGIFGLVAEHDATLVGLAHILFHPSSWSHYPSCYLEDLFVAPAARGTDAGKGLIEAVAAMAKSRGADRLYWHTQEFNAPARSLYDSVAQRTSFIVYRMGI
ncbi:MAG: GNAT family N-acetyltransferase [Rhodospirillales bacterium]